MSDQFDVLFNNITSNQAPGLNEYEKSLFLTKAEKEIVKNYFTPNSKGNNLGQGFDDSAKRQADFSVLMKTGGCTPVSSGGGTSTQRQYTCVSGGVTRILNSSQVSFLNNNVAYTPVAGNYSVTVSGSIATMTVNTDTITVIGYPFNASGTLDATDVTIDTVSGQIDDRSTVYTFPTDTFIVVNESIKTTSGKYLQVQPLRYDEYTRLMSKPFKRPLKNQAWRLMNTGTVSGNTALKYVEIITNVEDTVGAYNIRYVRTPKPIIVANLDGLSIDGEGTTSTACEIDPILHEDILQRAVELAKIAWTATGQDNAQLVMTAGQRTE